MLNLLQMSKSGLAALALVCFSGALTVASADGSSDGLPHVSARPATRAAPESAAALADWQVAKRKDDPGTGWVIYTRELPDSDFEVFRLEAELDAPPGLVAAALSQNIRDPRVAQGDTEKKILRDEGNVVLVYSYIEMPLVSDRDVVTRSERLPALENGGHRFEWSATADGPAPLDGVVRLSESTGSWSFHPLSGNRTFAVYESHTDIGGSIPAWLVNRLMVDTVVDGLVSLRSRVERDRARLAAGEPGTSSKAH